MWRTFVKWFGGIYVLGRADIFIHDNGAFFSWRGTIQWEWLRGASKSQVP